MGASLHAQGNTPSEYLARKQLSRVNGQLMASAKYVPMYAIVDTCRRMHRTSPFLPVSYSALTLSISNRYFVAVTTHDRGTSKYMFDTFIAKKR